MAKTRFCVTQMKFGAVDDRDYFIGGRIGKYLLLNLADPDDVIA